MKLEQSWRHHPLSLSRYFLWLSPLFFFFSHDRTAVEETGKGERDGGGHAAHVAGSGVEPTNRLGSRSPYRVLLA